MTLLTKTIIGPSDNGRRMSLDEFETAEGVEGHLYELSRGEVVVTDVPNPLHGDIVFALRQQLGGYAVQRPDVAHRVFGGAECKLLIEPTQSERHPDLALYKTARPADDSSVWSIWVPELVVEVVSPGSEHRDYVEKAEDYLHFGVREYWIIDAARRTITTHRRVSGSWQKRELKKPDRYTTYLLPGFELDVATLLPE
jgi:Uma2 family endonuclease